MLVTLREQRDGELQIICITLTNRFQVAVCLFSNRSKMTSKCGKNKKWHTRCSRVCH